MSSTTLPVTWEERVWAFVAAWWQQIAITQAGIYLVASFGQGHNILPWWAAWGLALGMEGTYLRGLIDAGHVRGLGRRWATALIIGTYATIILWGIAYILGLPSVGVIPAEDLGPWWGGAIAAIHVLPVAYTGLCAAMLHRARSGEEASRRAAEEDEARERRREQQRQLDDEAAQERAERRRITLEAEERRAQLELWEDAQRRKAAVRASTANTAPQGSFPASGTGTNSLANTGANSSDEQLRAQVVAALAADPRRVRTQLARELGVGRTKLYDLIDQAIAAGELPPSVKG